MQPPESASLNSRQLAGLNQRVRLYKYENNDADEFKLHRDDSNPGADFGRNAEGGVDRTMMNWDHDGDRQSLFTFLLYLNDDFDGGETVLLHPASASDESTKVQPRQGSVLVFPQTAKLDSSTEELHRANQISPLHAGNKVRRRSSGSRPKYVLRSDVLFGNLDVSSGYRFGERI